MSRIDVDSGTFQAASRTVGHDMTQALANAYSALTSALAGSGAMAGSDNAGQQWAGSYDQAATTTLQAINDVGTALFQLAALLEQTGFNHEGAEYASTAGRTSGAVDRTQYDGMSMTCAVCAPPSAAGGSSSPPDGWGLVQHLVGYVWPNGHQNRLRQAAHAWSQAADAIETIAPMALTARDAVYEQQSPEVDDAARVTSAMQGHLNDVASSCRQVGQSCNDFAAEIDKAHNSIKDELVSLLEWTAGIEAGGFLVGLFTFGGGEAAAQVAEATRIAATARRIATFIEGLIRAAGPIAETVTAAASRVTSVVERLKPLIGARITTVAVDEAGATTDLAATGEQAAERALAEAAERKAADDALYEQYCKRKLAEGKTPRSRRAWQNLTDSLRRNKLVGDAYRDQVAKDMGITPGEAGWRTEYTDSSYGRRFDIANPTEQRAIEVKSGTTPVEEGLTQLDKDEMAVEDGWNITWHLKTRLDEALMTRLDQLAKQYPGRFSYTIAGG